VRRRRIEHKSSEALRAEATADREAGERDARLVLERSLESWAKLEDEADEAELRERIAARRAEITDAAASASRAALKARAAGDKAAGDADRHAARRGELHARLVEQEMLRRQRLDEIERATADGDVDRALALERTLDENDLESLRAEVTRAAAAEQDASTRAEQFAAAAERHASEAAELRASFDAVEDELRVEYDTRRRARARLLRDELRIFDRRYLAFAAAMQAGADQLLRDAERAKPIDSASVVDDSIVIRKDPDGRFVGVDLPLNGVG
jgi:hypothetical protein